MRKISNTIARVMGCFYCLTASWTYALSEPEQTTVVGVKSLPPQYDVAFSRTAYPTAMLRPLHRGLVKVDQYGLIQGDLAKKWEFSSDKTRYSFCTEKFSFNNGQKATLDDIKFSFQRYDDETHISLHSWFYKNLHPTVTPYSGTNRSFDSTNELCFDVRLKVPYSGFLHLLSSPLFSLVPKQGSSLPNGSAGEYCVKRLEPQLAEYAHCKEGGKASRRMILKVVPDDATASEWLSAGKIDMYLGISDFGDTNAHIIQHRNLHSSYLNDLGISGFLFNTQIPWLQDREFRQDFGHLVQDIVRRNKSSLSRSLEFFPHLIPDGLLSKSYYKPGFSADSNEWFIKKWQGKLAPSHFDIIARFNQLGRKPIDEIKETLKKIGLNVQYTGENTPATTEKLKAGAYHIAFYTWMASMDRIDEFFAMTDNFLKGRSNKAQDLDRYLNSIRDLLEVREYGERVKGFEKVVTQIEDEYVMVPLFRIKTPILHKEKIHIPQSKWRYTPAIAEFYMPL